MKGLLRNNYYATIANAKLFFIVTILLCALSVVTKSQMLLGAFILLCMIGFSVISIVGLRREIASKWNKYKITTPLKRVDIIRSYFLSHLLWLIVGMLIAGAGVALSVILSGLLFDKNIDIFNFYILGIGISLFTGAFFFPLFFSRNGEERNEAFLAISLFCGIGIIAGLAMLMNAVFPTPMSNAQIIIAGIIIMAIAVFAITISCFLTISIYRKRDY